MAATGKMTPYSTSFSSVLVLVLWIVGLTGGLLGLAHPYDWRQPAKTDLAVVEAKLVKVELTSQPVSPAPPSLTPPPLDAAAPPPPPEAENIPPPPALLAVARPEAVAFAVPVEVKDVVVVEDTARAVVRPTVAPAPTRPTGPQLRILTYGEGEGRQPAPQYPRTAIRRRQEGLVVVRFAVGIDGRVLSALARQPSAWPLLNDAAVDAVKKRWWFRPGTNRLFEVAIRFELPD